MATVQPQVPHAVIDGKSYGAFPNPALTKDGEPVSAMGHLIDYNKSADGTFRFLQLIDRVCQAISLVLEEFNSTLAIYFKDLAGKFATAWVFMNYARLPSVTKDAWEAVTDLSGPQAATTRDSIDRVDKLFHGGAAWGYVISYLTDSLGVRTIADVVDVIGTTAGLTLACDDWFKAKKHLEHLKTHDATNGLLQQRFAETQLEAFWRIVKNVASIASGVLGLLVLAFGGPVLSAAALLTISLISTIAAMTAHFTKATNTYELVDFYKVREPRVLLTGSAVY